MLRLRLTFANRTYYTMAPRSGHNKTASIAVLHGSMFSKQCAISASAHEVRAAAQAAGLRLLYHIFKLTLRALLAFTKKHGIYAARLMLRLRLAFTNRTYYTMTPRSSHNKTAPPAFLHGSMFSKPMCGSASAHEERAAAQAADLRLLYHIPPKARSILHAFYNHPYLRINP